MHPKIVGIFTPFAQRVELIGRMISILSKKQKCALVKMLLLTLAVGVVDALGVASIAPLITLFSSGGAPFGQYFQLFHSFFEFSPEYAGSIIILIIVSIFFIGLALKCASIYFIADFVRNLEVDLGRRLLSIALKREYLWHLRTHSSKLSRQVLMDVGSAVNGFVGPLLSLLSNSILVICIFVLILVIDARVALGSLSVLLVLYLIIFFLVGSALRQAGRTKVFANEQRFRIVTEVLNSIPEVKIYSLEGFAEETYFTAAKNYSKSQVNAVVLSQSPRYVVEFLVFAFLILGGGVYIWSGRDLTPILPLLGIYLVAGYRLLPLCQQVFNSVSQIRYHFPTYQKVMNEFYGDAEVRGLSQFMPVEFSEEVLFSGVSFCYPDASSPSISDITLSIKKGDSVAIVAESGGGKSTLISLLTGLIDADSGEILVDGRCLVPIQKRNWMAGIGYVPQTIKLFDETIISNIALGIAGPEIDLQLVHKVCEITGLTDVIGDLPFGYETRLGENGALLSGGQRQRLGIARALYRQPKLLILDEATSALDAKSENSVCRSIRENLSGVTMVTVTHRLDTIKTCDMIFVLKRGKLIGSGSYCDLIQDCEEFKSLSDADGRNV